MWIGDVIEKFEAKAFTINGVTYYPADYVLEQLNTLSRRCVRWMEDDFEHEAMQNYDSLTWQRYYDSTKFTEALEDMIENQDCEIGINWNTVSYYLEKHCKRSEKAIKKAMEEDEQPEIEL